MGLLIVQGVQCLVLGQFLHFCQTRFVCIDIVTSYPVHDVVEAVCHLCLLLKAFRNLFLNMSDAWKN